MKTPDYLKHGDTIGFLSTARKASKEELAPVVKFVEELGLRVKLGKTIGAEHHQFAGDDALRISDMQNMLDNPEIKAIWCVRGGYGTVRIIDALDFTKFIEHPKWIVGYSDMTILHAQINKLGIKSLHAPIAATVMKNTQESIDSIQTVLMGNPYAIKEESNNKLNRFGTAEGELTGGNISILYSLCGSSSCINTQGKILFLEDLDEYLYHIDRMMMNLKRNGLLDNLAGLVVGGLTDMNDNEVPFGKQAEEIIYDAVKEFDYPVCFDFPAGHIEDNRALIMGNQVRLTVSEGRVALEFLNE